MNRKKVVHVLINMMKKALKWFLILLAISFTILVLVAVYLLISEFFYDGETLGLA